MVLFFLPVVSPNYKLYRFPHGESLSSLHIYSVRVCVCPWARCVCVWLPVGPDAGLCTVCKSGASRVAQAWPGLCRALSSECLQQCSPPQLRPASLANKDLGHLDPPTPPPTRISSQFVNVTLSHCFWWSADVEFKVFTGVVCLVATHLILYQMYFVVFCLRTLHIMILNLVVSSSLDLHLYTCKMIRCVYTVYIVRIHDPVII